MLRKADETQVGSATGVVPRNDEELFLAFREQGDQQAFDELVHRYERELYSYLRRYLGNADLADEIFQATFIQLYEKQNLYQPGRRLRPWIYSIATHLAIDLFRKRGRHRLVSLESPPSEGASTQGSVVEFLQTPVPGPLAQAEATEESEWLREAVDHLPEHLRAVILLVYFQGMKYHEVAEVLQVPLGTVKSRVHTALVKLNAAWHESQPGSKLAGHASSLGALHRPRSKAESIEGDLGNSTSAASKQDRRDELAELRSRMARFRLEAPISSEFSHLADRTCERLHQQSKPENPD